MRNRILLFTAVLLALFLGGCASQETTTETTYPEDKTIFGVPVEGMTKAEGRAAVRKKVDDYSIRVVMGETETVLTAKDLGLTYKSGKINVSAKNSLLKKLPGLPEDENVGDEKAHVIYSPEEERFLAVNGTARLHWQLDKIVSSIRSAAKKGKAKVTVEPTSVMLPAEAAAKSPELVYAAVDANRILDSLQILLTDDKGRNPEYVTPDRAEIASWIAVDENGALTALQEPLQAYCEALREEKAAPGRGATYFLSTAGEDVLIQEGSGYQIDAPALAEAITAVITSGAEPTVEASYLPCWGEPRYTTFEGCYVEADLTNQMVYMYYLGECLVETPCVSGCPERGDATPTGVFTIFERFTDAKLFGETKISYVDYWMGFSGMCGFHDASWRTTYGGDRYLHHGSHGCINLPFDAAQKMFYLVYEGIPVIVHGGVSELHDAVITKQPKSVTRAEGKTAKFTVEAEYGEKYQWYYWKPGADKWVKSTAKGANTPTLTVKVSEKTAGNVYRCRITGESGQKIYSDAVTVTLK